MNSTIQKLVSFLTALFKSFNLQRQKDRSRKGTEDHQRYVKQLKGNAARLEAHRRSCIQGYRAKKALVLADKGRNTMKGTPQVGQPFTTVNS